MSDKLLHKLESVNDQNSFIEFVEALAMERQSVEGVPHSLDGFQSEWANSTIAEFLGASVQWASDSDFGLRPGPKPKNQWQLFAMFLWAGRGYE